MNNNGEELVELISVLCTIESTWIFSRPVTRLIGFLGALAKFHCDVPAFLSINISARDGDEIVACCTETTFNRKLITMTSRDQLPDTLLTTSSTSYVFFFVLYTKM